MKTLSERLAASEAKLQDSEAMRRRLIAEFAPRPCALEDCHCSTCETLRANDALGYSDDAGEQDDPGWPENKHDSKKFWDGVARTAAEVANWPEWMRRPWPKNLTPDPSAVDDPPKQDAGERAIAQLAGCLIAAEGGDTSECTSDPDSRGHYGWSLALETVRELRAKVDGPSPGDAAEQGEDMAGLFGVEITAIREHGVPIAARDNPLFDSICALWDEISKLKRKQGPGDAAAAEQHAANSEPAILAERIDFWTGRIDACMEAVRDIRRKLGEPGESVEDEARWIASMAAILLAPGESGGRLKVVSDAMVLLARSRAAVCKERSDG